ncbi:MAG: RHS repeat-associated core domain-containing protein, partial [Bacteroidales bacterium]|nr:RHS repeat-associated core domain-containing protein [Bacteroidales bacterium]
MWLGVDPMAEKYSNMGAYVYCANNPVKLVDPDGRKIVVHDKESQNSILKTLPT